MKKKTKKKPARRFRYEAIPAITLPFICIGLCFSAYLGEVGNSYSKQIQDVERQIHQIQMENDAVSVEVNTLNTKERVAGIAAEDGLNLDQDNIITIKKTTIEGE